MDIGLALKKRDRAISQLKDLYSGAEIFGLTSSQINERYNTILDGLAKCPQWTHEYVSGYRAALTDALYRNALVYGGILEGTFYSTHSNRADYYGHSIKPNEWCEWGDSGRVTSSGHYWIRHVDAGKPKPFFIMEKTQ